MGVFVFLRVVVVAMRMSMVVRVYLTLVMRRAVSMIGVRMIVAVAV
jgi:hypothetical protein